MIKTPLMRAFAALLVVVIAVAADASIKVTAQLLDVEKGYVFFTTGDGFKLAPNAPVLDYKTGAAAKNSPGPRDWARATFDSTGTVTELEVSRTALEPEGDLASVHRFAIALTPPTVNSELAPPPTADFSHQTFSGKPVLVTFSVQVPPTTPLTATIYITTDQSAWDPQAIRLDRIDALHFQVTRRFNSGTRFAYLYTRGSLSTQERGENGISRVPRHVLVTDADARVVSDTVFQWADSSVGGQQPQPEGIPTPYNPLPFPNLPVPGSLPTKHP
jgi:pullulanase